jgi:tetratricopeptide (TPR) repeat protein
LPPVVRGPAVPRFVAGYEVLGILGHGGMGVVFKARQVGLNRLVALKMLRSPLAAREEQSRFHTEAEAVARLQHPNIVQVFEVGEHEGLPFFSLELVEGGSLDRRLGGSPLPPAAAVHLVYTLARAMQTAHDKGIVHRDLKPANILLAPAVPDGTPPDEGPDLGMPKITDFGLAKCLFEAPGLPTQSGAVLGTPSYMAPEQADAQAQDIGPWTDVYALGAILYEMLTGRPPFRGATVLDTLDQVRTQEPVPLRRLQPKVPRDLETICLKCLEKEPAKRYPRATDLADDLWRYLNSEPIHARPAGVVDRVLKWGHRRPTLSVLLVLLAVAPPLIIAYQHVALERGRREGQQEHQARVVADLKASCQGWLREGEAALRRGKTDDLHTARERFQRVSEQVSDTLAREDEELAQLRQDANQGAAEAKGRLDYLVAGEVARDHYDLFFRLRDEAYFRLHRDLLVTGSASPEDCREVARTALALFGLDGSRPGQRPDLSRYEAPKQERLRNGLYEMALLLAEATARSRPDGGKGKADVEWEKKQAGEAAAILDRVSAWAPLGRIGKLRRARYRATQGDAAGAAADRATAAELAPGTALEWFLAGQDKILTADDPRAAAPDLDAALRQEPDLFWARFLRALVRGRMHRPGEALGDLEACIQGRPEFVWSYLFHGALCGQAGQAGQAGRFADAAADFARAEKMPLDDSARYVLHVNRGLVALARGEVREAVRDLRQAVRIAPGEYHGHVDLAAALADQQDLDGAVAAMGEAIALKPEMPELWRARAGLHRDRHDRAAALQDLNEAIRLGEQGSPSPALAKDYFRRALLLNDGGRHAEAARDCAAAVELLPDCADAWRLRGEALQKQGKHRDALDAFDRYLALEKPTDPEVFKQRALARAALEDFPGVPEEYTRALALRRDADTYVQRGWAYVVNEAMRLARADFEEALKLAPQHPGALVGRGLIRVTGHDYRAGLKDAEEGVRRAPESSLLRYNAARVLAQAAATAAADPRLGARAADVRKDYEAQAVRRLREALDLVEPAEQARFWRDTVLGDLLLVPVRGCPEFVELARKFPTPRK